MPGAVYQALEAELRGPEWARTLDLYAAATGQPALAPLVGVLRLFGITDSYVVQSAVLAQPGAVVLGGRSSFGVPGTVPADASAVEVRLVVEGPDGPAPRFELTLSFTDPGWTFSTTFPTLPPTPRERGGGVRYVPSFLEGLPLGSPRLSAASDPGAVLVLAGSLGPDGALEPYAGTFAPWPLRLSGTVVLPPSPDEPPQMWLTAVAPALSLQVGSVAVRDVGLGMQVLTGLDPDDDGITAISNLLLVGTAALGAVDPIVAQLSAVLLSPGSVWRMMVAFPPGRFMLSYGLAQIAGFLGVQASQLIAPDGFGDFGGFYLSGIELGVGAPTGGVFPLPKYAAVTLGSDRAWHPPLPFVLVRQVSMRWLVQWERPGDPLSARLWGAVSGTFVVGEGAPPPGQPAPLLGPPAPPGPEGGDDGGDGDGADGEGDGGPATSFRVDTVAELPSFSVKGSLRDGDEIPIGYAFRTFFGDPGPPTPGDMAVTSFRFSADPLQLTLDASAAITTGWSVPLGCGLALELTELSFEIGVTPAGVTGGITGTVELEGVTAEGDPPATFVLRAAYRGSGSGEGWIFTGELYPDTYLDLVQAAVSFLGLDHAPAGLPSLSVQDVFLSFTTGTGAYAVRGTVVGRWTPYVFGRQLALSAAAAVDLASPDGGAPAGRLTGTFAVNRLALTVAIDVGVDDPTYLFRIQLGPLWLDAVTGWRGTGQARHQVLSVQLGGTTVGAILEYLVGLAAPTLGYTLDAPWSVLNQVELPRFLLTVDPAESTVELTCRVGLDLVFMQVDTVGVRYRQADGDGAVEMILTGRMLDRTYDGTRPLSWDVVRDPPPAVPGQGGALVDLRYLGLGQRVTLRGIDGMGTVAEVLDALQRDMQPPADSRANPLEQPGGSAMVFAPESQWLIGLDVGLMENAIRVGLIFNDPRLYGLSVGLSGERMGALAGLKFEILYKKVSDDVGVFRVELRLPDVLRHLELGEVSITLGLIVVEVYTNGSFMVDLGFPYDRDFGRSFSIEVFPYIGRGGIYVGVLNGATSTRVPAITNGTFAPVLELGVGLALGVGKDVTAGPLSGGIYVQLEVVFQGVVAWFNPASSGQPPAPYYRAQGVAALHGRLYAQVDFKVVKVSVSVEAYAQVSATLEACRSTVFALTVAADARATVRVAFVDVDFTYHVQLDASVTVGADRATPWLLAGGPPSPPSHRARGSDAAAVARQPARRTRALAQTHARAVNRSRAGAALAGRGVGDPGLLDWAPLGSVFAGGPRPVAVTLLPAFGIDRLPLAWGGDAPQNPDPAYRVAFLLFAETGSGTSAGTLVEGFLRWAIRAVTGTPGGGEAAVTAGQLRLLAEEMERPGTADGGFSAANLAAFFGASMPLRVAGDPGGTPAPQRGMAFPMPPPLAYTAAPGGAYDFAADGRIGPLYEWGAARYAARLFPLPTPSTDPPPDDPEAYESFASFVFRDWCLMVARSAVQAARDQMQAWTYRVADESSLAGIAASFPVVTVDYAVRAGDTVASVADALGATVEELEALNGGDRFSRVLADAEAGSAVPVTLGVSPAAVAEDNATVPLAADRHLSLGAIDYLAAHGDTLAGIADRFGLAGAPALFAGTGLEDEVLLLRPGATFQAPAAAWRPPAGWSATLAAAVLYVHYFGGRGVPEAGWYAQTVFDLNADGALAAVSFDETVPAGTQLDVPAAPSDSSAGPRPYTAVAGDTLSRIGATLALAQVWGDAGDGPEPAWPAFRDGVTLGDGVASVPASTLAVLPGETVSLLADRTLVHAGDVEGLLGWIGAADVLRPLAPIHVPSVTLLTRAGDVLADLARDYGLTVAELAARILTAPGLWPVDADAPVELTVTHLPAQHIDALVGAVLAGGAPSQIAGSVSRWMMSGLRLPAPVGVQDEPDPAVHQAAEGPPTALYALTGQQLTAPPVDGGAPDATALAVTFTLSPTARQPGRWIQLVSSTVVEEGESAGDVAARAPRLAELNPRGAVELPAAGSVVLADTVDSLVFSYTNAQLASEYPAPSLVLRAVDGPAPLPLAGITPRTYGLGHRVPLQSPVPLPVPTVGDAPLAGVPSLWPFASDFRARARAATGTPYELVTASRAGGDGAGETVLDATWATLLPFGVRRMDGAEGVYALRGADTAARRVLLDAWRYLQTGQAEGTQAFLLVAPSPDARNLTGLIVLAVDAASTFLVQSNLSTATAPGVRSPRAPRLDVAGEPPAPPTWGPYFASFADLEPFARLLWEGSVVGGTGYHLGLRTADGAGIPQPAFDADGNATLYLLLVAGEQQAPAVAGRPLLSINNCALVGPGLGAAAHSLYAEAADGSEPVARAVVPPGSVGFTLTLPQPVDEGPGDADTRLRRLFSMVTWQVDAAEGSPFTASDPGLPVPPLAQDGDREPPSEKRRRARRERAARAAGRRQARAARSAGPAPELDAVPDPPPDGDARWLYEQVIPIWRQGPASAAPAVDGLPDPADDPYRGIGSTALATASIRLGLADVAGNGSADGGDATVRAPAGYTDPLIGVTGWPAVAPTFAVEEWAGAPWLTVHVEPQPGAVAPSPLESVLASAERASRQAETYARAYYQLSQPGVSAALVTTLRQAHDGTPVPLAMDVALLWRFAAAGWLAARAAASLGPVRPAAEAAASLASIASDWGVSWAALATANADQPAASVLRGASPVVPAYLVFATGDTASSLAAPRPGWPSNSGAGLLALPRNANELPLRPGAVLVIPVSEYRLDPADPAPPLNDVAADAHTTAALLAADNAAAAGVLAEGFVFEMGGMAVTAGVTRLRSGTVAATFDLVRQAFEEVGIHAATGDIAAANGGRPGMLNPGATFATRRYVAEDGDTLGANATGFAAEQLAAANASTPDLYDAGALLYAGDFDAAVTHPLDGTETLRQLADRFACPLEQILAASADLVLPAGSTLLVPGAGTITADARVPYTVLGDDTIQGVAQRFAFDPDPSPEESLVSANLWMPGTVNPGMRVTLTVGGKHVSTETQPGDSFGSVLARLDESADVTLADFLAAVATLEYFLAGDALLVCPPARLPADALSFSDAGMTYGVYPVGFAQANAGTAGLIREGVTVELDDDDTTVKTVANDTLNALVSRFAAAGVQVGLTELVQANDDLPLLVQNALALLPPRPAILSAQLGTSPGPFAAPIFPLRAGIRIDRPAPVVSPEFATGGTGPVERAESFFPAPQGATGAGDAATLTLDEFVRGFQIALPTLRLATGRVEGTDDDLWVVDFGPAGIASVAVQPGVAVGGETWPRFFALRPLYHDLVSRQGVPFPALDADGSLAEATTPTDFQGVDVEVWARRFLADVDLVLTALYAGAAYLNPAARPALQALIDAKRLLGEAIPRGLDAVLDVGDPREAAGLAEAARRLGEELDVGLSRAYEVAALVQYDAAVTSAWTAPGSNLRPARLSGTPVSVDAGDEGVSADHRPFTLTGAKIPLDQAAPFVTFLMRVSDPAHHGRVAVDLDLSVLDLEFGITPVPGVEGYEASDWLAFVPPLAGDSAPDALRASLGGATVPIPLRAYPALPALLGQGAGPSFDTADTLAHAAEWTYSLTYSHEHAEQDEVLVTARFNVAPPHARLGRDLSLDVASALARYVAVADPLWARLDGFADETRGVDADVLANAATSFASLAGDVAAAWATHWPGAPEPRPADASPKQDASASAGQQGEPGPPPGALAGMQVQGGGGAARGSVEPSRIPVGGAPVLETYGYSVRLTDREGENGVMVLDTLVLVAVDGSNGPGGSFPEVAARAPDGTRIGLVPYEGEGPVRRFQFPEATPVPASDWPVITLRWPNLPVAGYQNAEGSISVRRNQRLLGPDGPATTTGFIYQSPAVTATDVIAPLNSWTDAFDITPLGADVRTALQAAFDQLFSGTGGHPVTVGMFFGYELVAGTSLATYLPVGLYPNQTLGPDTAAAIATALADWQQANQPAATRAEWAFSLTACSQLEPDTRRPLLTFDRLVYRIVPS